MGVGLNLQLRRMLLVSVALVIVAAVLGASVGYDVSPVRTSTTTLVQAQTLPTTVTETVPTTIMTAVSLSGQTYTVLTVTARIVLVYIFLPECVTTSGQTSTTYVSPVGGQTTTVTYVYPSNITGATLVSFTTITNNTGTFSYRTQSESISC